jgi:N-acetylglucosaminyldiphosphoundecaprenol N-acetyl-beta-D-mannosaminyltransferase
MMSTPGPSIHILGIRVDDVTMEEAVGHIARFLREGHPHQVVTVNPEFIMLAQRDPAFAEVINTADLAVPDGAWLLWAARHRGQRLRQRVAGVDLMCALIPLAASLGARVFFLGAAPGVAGEVADRLRAVVPGLVVAGTYAGSPHPDEEEEIVARVREGQTDLLFVAYGAPQQDLWIRRTISRLGVRVAMGVGGAFDFISGRVPRAPVWMRERGLEWLYRLVRQPWRWRRMSVLPLFVWYILTRREGEESGRK